MNTEINQVTVRLSEEETARDQTAAAPALSVVAQLVAGARHWDDALQIGRFTVLEEIGRGGMGIIVAAYDSELDRKVAIKLMRACGERNRQRVYHEARALAALSHPNVVSVYEVGEIEGQIFVAMEYVRGTIFRTWQAQQRERWNNVLDAYIQAGRGLIAAHRAGIVHRDFKPENVILGDDGRVRVLDFGLAFRPDTRQDVWDTSPGPPPSPVGTGSEPGDDRLTAPGVVVGTLNYMSPEQRRGEAVTVASDQYSFCLALYEAIYRRRPFKKRATEQSGNPAPPARPPADTDVPPRVYAAIARGLDIDPSNRWPSMDALVEALVATQRHKTRLPLLIGVGVAAAATAAILWGTTTHDDRCRDGSTQLNGIWDDERRALLNDVITSSDAPDPAATWQRFESRVDSYAQAWTTLWETTCRQSNTPDTERAPPAAMACLHGERLRLRQLLLAVQELGGGSWRHTVSAIPTPIQLRKCTNQAQRSTPQPAVDEALWTELYAAQARLSLADSTGANAIAERIQTSSRELARSTLQAQASLVQSQALMDLGDFEAADKAAGTAFSIAEVVGDDRTAAAALITRVFGRGYRLAQYDEGLRWAELAEAKLHRYGQDGSLASQLAGARGAILSSRGQHTAAYEAFLAALIAVEQSGQLSSAAGALALDNVGHSLDRLERPTEAQSYYERALTLRRQLLGDQHPDLAMSLVAMGNLSLSVGNLDQAEDALNRALQIQQRAFEPKHPDVAVTHNMLGQVAIARHEHAQARVHFERALAGFDAGAPESGEIAITLLNAAAMDAELGEPKRARERLRHVIEIGGRIEGPEGSLVANATLALGRLSLSAAQCERAQPLLDRGLDLRQSGAAPPGRIARARFDLARSLWNSECGLVEPSSRAYHLVELAAESFKAGGPAYAEDLTAATDWLKGHPL